MMVRSGWNSEYARKKFDVELDEVDLARVLAENISGSSDAIAVASGLTAAEAFQVLYAEAEVLAKAALAQFDPSAAGRMKGEIAQHRKKQAAVLSAVKKRLAVE